MEIAGVKLYIYMMAFAFWSVAGLMAEQFWELIVEKRKVRRGLMPAPISGMYGVSGLFATVISALTSKIWLRIILSIAIFIAAVYVTDLLCKMICGTSIWKLEREKLIPMAVWGMALGILSGVVVSILDLILPMLAMVLLLIYYVVLVVQGIDTIYMMTTLKRILSTKKTLTDDQRLVVIKPYKRWIKAYPEIKNALIKKLIGES